MIDDVSAFSWLKPLRPIALSLSLPPMRLTNYRYNPSSPCVCVCVCECSPGCAFAVNNAVIMLSRAYRVYIYSI